MSARPRNEREADLRRCARVSRDTVTGGGDGPALGVRSRSRGDTERESARDQSPTVHFRRPTVDGHVSLPRFLNLGERRSGQHDNSERNENRQHNFSNHQSSSLEWHTSHELAESVLLGSDCAAEIDHGQHDENEGLQQATKNAEKHHGYRNEPRDHECEDRDDELLTEDVAEQGVATATRHG